MKFILLFLLVLSCCIIISCERYNFEFETGTEEGISNPENTDSEGQKEIEEGATDRVEGIIFKTNFANDSGYLAETDENRRAPAPVGFDASYFLQEVVLKF